MKKTPFLIGLIIPVLFSISGCNSSSIKREEDLRTVSEMERTVNSITATDVYGRVTPVSDLRNNEKRVGVFYHVWHGYHTNGIYNITQLLEDDPDSLWNPDGTAASPKNTFHYWGEPMYGYYNSSDPWVITRHMELFTMAGVDYLIYDLTNTVIYTDAINSIFKVLDKYQKQGFDVPKVAFYTNSNSGNTMKRCYDLWYKDGLYSNLWYSMDGVHPLIIGISDELDTQYPDVADEMKNFFQIKESQWPSATRFDRENGFPWMDWEYPQRNYSGTISVSLAQHPGMRMSEGSETNNGRGFDYAHYCNDESTARMGTNVEGQWQTAFDNPKKVNNVFVTGWNEWIAVKMADGGGRVFFVDTFNENYSRDMEMYRDGYGDNFYLQFTRNIRKFKFSEGKHYVHPTTSIVTNDLSEEQWNDVKTVYRDFSGDAMERNFISADKRTYLVDNSNRNDIVRTSVTHDKKNIYFRIETKESITSPIANDHSWMNILINTGKNSDSFSGYDYVINRNINGNHGSIERLRDGFLTDTVGDAEICYQDNVLQVAVPLTSIKKSKKDYSFQFKVCDNIQEQDDILDYYISGDSAPIGRLSYSYGY